MTPSIKACRDEDLNASAAREFEEGGRHALPILWT
jgi:hypothetical protein